MSGIFYDPNVVFNAGAPIDINKLNKLQSNIASVKLDSDKGIQNATVTIQGVQRNIKVTPVIFAGRILIKLNSNRGFDQIDFSGSGFDEKPILVASISTNTAPSDQATLRATATSKTGGNIEVFTASTSKLKELEVNYIAVQMKQVE